MNTKNSPTKGNILVVDDTPANLRLLNSMLRDNGYDVRPVPNGRLALTGAKAIPPDLVLLDIIMPGMDGYEVCRALKKDMNLKDVPVIFISALNEVSDKIKGFKAGGVDYISKPFQTEEVLARVETHLALKNLRKELESKNARLQQVNEALLESKANLDKAQTIAHIGNWSRSLDLNHARWSNEMYRIFGLTPGTPGEVSFEFFMSLVHPEYREKVASLLKEAVRTKEPFDFEYRTVPIEGLERVIMERGEVELDETGFPVRFFGTDQDVTETKRLQEQLLASQKTEAIATLAGGVAHEFNNSLVGIMGNIELLKLNFPGDGGQNQSLDTMNIAGHRMSRLTDQLLAYAQGGKYQPKDLKFDDFLREVLPILQHELSPPVRMETHFQKDISHISADNAQMQMVLSAILINSHEAIEDEGLIRVTAENEDVDEDLARQNPDIKPGSYVCLTVEDDGKGMDEETRKGIFEPFFTTKFQGRGMGMAAVYGIVRNHNGWIYVDSELGRGTTVRVYLPAIEIEVAKPKKAETTVATGTGTILMIEDEDVVIEVTQAMLEMLGYRVMVAKTGKDAVHIAETFDGQIDLALLDIKLPDINGRNLYPLIMKARSNLKVIVWSGYSIDGPAREILDAGAQDFIQKPFSIATLSEKLKVVLEGE